MALSLTQLQNVVKHIVDSEPFLHTPEELYAPIEYSLRLGGKRLRPTMLLAACQLFGGDIEAAHPAALAVEVFHNYTLVHDDLMDGSLMRRGKPTVCHRWNENTALLSGDAMLIMAFKYLSAPAVCRLLRMFSQMAIDVVRGQQYDMNFERRLDVSVDEYLDMIYLKTAVLFCGALRMGATLADAPAADIELLMQYGRNLGLAFQLQDDVLDTYGDENTFGKKTGQDISDNKKTMLLITALADANSDQRAALHKLLALPKSDAKVEAVRAIYDCVGVRSKVEKLIGDYLRQADAALAAIHATYEAKAPLRDLLQKLVGRHS